MNLRALGTFACLQGLLWGCVSFLFFRVGGFYTDPLGLFFTFVFIVGHIGLFALCGALLCAPFYLIGPRTLRTVCVGLHSLAFVLFLIDYEVYSQYHFHIGMGVLEMFFGEAGREIFVFSATMWTIAFVAFLGIIALQWFLSALAKKWQFSTRVLLIVFTLWALCFTSYNLLYAWGKFNRIPSIVSQRHALPLTYPLSATRRLEKWGFVQPDNPYSVHDGGTLNYPREPLTCTMPAHPKNILLILIDSLRADMLNPDVMPYTYAWAQRVGASQFTNHLSGANATMGGVFSLFYSLPHSYWDHITASRVSPVLITKILENGYFPAIFASSKLTSPTFHRNVFADIANLRIGSEGNTSSERDEDAVNGFIDFLQTRDPNQPFFGFVFLDAPHAYDYPPDTKKFTPAKPINYLILTNKTDPVPYFNQYKNAVHFDDSQLERIFRALQDSGANKDTIVLISGDHGQELNDSHKNYWGHNSNFSDYQTKVPLLVYMPNRQGQTYTYRTTHYDIVPTLLQDVFGCTNPAADYSIGQHLFDATPRPFSILLSATAKAIRIEDQILVLQDFGGIKIYDPALNPLDSSPDSAVVKEALKTFSNFYK